ncbi:MAG: hypothetical protein MUC50_22305 [Myxococcota bacterium]|jgi:hypothetical protein|nr:hypothetical protein [Myxococcota bacterium]
MSRCLPLFPQVLAFALLAVSCAPTAAQRGETPLARRAPDLSVGALLGYANHFGKTSEVDGTTSATVQLPERDIADSGAAAGLRLDAGLLPLGRGDLGLSLDVLGSFPQVYFDFVLTPRYRLNLETGSAAVSSVEPWLGLPLTFTVPQEADDFFFSLGGALGCDLGLAQTPWRIGLVLHVNAINPKPIRYTVIADAGQVHEMESRLDNVLVLLSASYVFF